MKKYRHRETGYEIEVTHFAGCKVYRVYGYSVACGWIELGENDFHKLFEPVREFCCEELGDCIDKRLIVKDEGMGKPRCFQTWRCDLDTAGLIMQVSIFYCPFCGKKLE